MMCLASTRLAHLPDTMLMSVKMKLNLDYLLEKVIALQLLLYMSSRRALGSDLGILGFHSRLHKAEVNRVRSVAVSHSIGACLQREAARLFATADSAEWLHRRTRSALLFAA